MIFFRDIFKWFINGVLNFNINVYNYLNSDSILDDHLSSSSDSSTDSINTNDTKNSNYSAHSTSSYQSSSGSEEILKNHRDLIPFL
jgi:hypothetical protein